MIVIANDLKQVTTSLLPDFDECATPEANECDLNAMCTNTEGSYVCRCRRGYAGDGRNCTGEYFPLIWFIDYTNILDLEVRFLF